MRKTFILLLAGLLTLCAVPKAVLAATAYTYAYDTNNRLLNISSDGVIIFGFKYDKNGNLIKKEKYDMAYGGKVTVTTTRVSVSQGGVRTEAMVEWNMGKTGKPPKSFKLIRNGWIKYITATQTATGYSYKDTSLPSGNYQYYVVPVYESGEGSAYQFNLAYGPSGGISTGDPDPSM